MKPAKLVPFALAVFCLTFIVMAQLPQQQQTQPGQQIDQDRIEAAHGQLLSAKDKAAEASRLTDAVAPALPGAVVSSAPVPKKQLR